MGDRLLDAAARRARDRSVPSDVGRGRVVPRAGNRHRGMLTSLGLGHSVAQSSQAAGRFSASSTATMKYATVAMTRYLPIAAPGWRSRCRSRGWARGISVQRTRIDADDRTDAPAVDASRLPSRSAHSLSFASSHSLALSYPSVSLPILCSRSHVARRGGSRTRGVDPTALDGRNGPTPFAPELSPRLCLSVAPVTTRRKGTRSIARLRTSWLADAVV